MGPCLAALLAALLLAGCTEQRSEKTAEDEEPRRDVSGYLPGHGPGAPAWSPGGAPPAVETAPLPAVPRAATDAGPVIRGRIDLAPGAQAPPGAVLFIIARPAGGQNGPPLAVKRVAAPDFPLAFTLSSDDSMMPGRSLEGPVDVSARLDSDGNASTREAGDLSGAFEGNPVEAGQAGIEIELDAPRP